MKLTKEQQKEYKNLVKQLGHKPDYSLEIFFKEVISWGWFNYKIKPTSKDNSDMCLFNFELSAHSGNEPKLIAYISVFAVSTNTVFFKVSEA